LLLILIKGILLLSSSSSSLLLSHFGVRRRGAYKVLVGKTERPLGRPRHR
jgi:hypothetical protein